MKKYRRIIGIAALVTCMSITACSKEKEFDAKGYVQSALDAVYHEEYANYAKVLEMSEEEVKKQQEEEFKEAMDQQFEGDDGITEEGIATYTEKMKQAYKLAKYEVQEAKKTEDGNYTVKVQVEPADIFQTLEESAKEVTDDKIAKGLDLEDPAVFAEVLAESIQKSIDKNAYGDPVTVEVTVEKDDSGAYGLAEAEMNKLEEAMFPGE